MDRANLIPCDTERPWSSLRFKRPHAVVHTHTYLGSGVDGVLKKELELCKNFIDAVS